MSDYNKYEYTLIQKTMLTIVTVLVAVILLIIAALIAGVVVYLFKEIAELLSYYPDIATQRYIYYTVALILFALFCVRVFIEFEQWS